MSMVLMNNTGENVFLKNNFGTGGLSVTWWQHNGCSFIFQNLTEPAKRLFLK